MFYKVENVDYYSLTKDVINFKTVWQIWRNLHETKQCIAISRRNHLSLLSQNPGGDPPSSWAPQSLEFHRSKHCNLRFIPYHISSSPFFFIFCSSICQFLLFRTLFQINFAQFHICIWTIEYLQLQKPLRYANHVKRTLAPWEVAPSTRNFATASPSFSRALFIL